MLKCYGWEDCISAIHFGTWLHMFHWWKPLSNHDTTPEPQTELNLTILFEKLGASLRWHAFGARVYFQHLVVFSSDLEQWTTFLVREAIAQVWHFNFQLEQELHSYLLEQMWRKLISHFYVLVVVSCTFLAGIFLTSSKLTCWLTCTSLLSGKNTIPLDDHG